jgi:hypothetical protein
MANDLFFSRDTKLIVAQGTTAWEIPVLDGFSFSQATNSSEITLNEMESGGVSRRGRKMFNDSVAPAEWSFSTYARPFLSTIDATDGWDGDSARMHAVEEALWAALTGNPTFVDGGADVNGSWSTAVANNVATMVIDFTDSNIATLKELDLYFVMGVGAYVAGTHQVYKLGQAVVNSATIDFDIDGITTIQWSGFARTIAEHTTAQDFTADIAEALTATNNFIRNRLTTLTVAAAAGQGDIVTSYDLTLTGGSISFENNISYLTPETIGSVNSPIGHVVGNRSIGGNFTCYLGNSSAGSSDLWEDLAGSTSVVTNIVSLTFDIGGTSAPTVQVALPTCHLEIPSHSIEDVISLETTFSALPSSITGADEATITYKGLTAA